MRDISLLKFRIDREPAHWERIHIASHRKCAYVVQASSWWIHSELLQNDSLWFETHTQTDTPHRIDGIFFFDHFFYYNFLSGETILSKKKLAKIATKRRRKIGGRYKLNMPLNGDTINADKLSGIAEESEQDVYEGFSPHVDRLQIVLPDPSPTSGKPWE